MRLCSWMESHSEQVILCSLSHSYVGGIECDRLHEDLTKREGL